MHDNKSPPREDNDAGQAGEQPQPRQPDQTAPRRQNQRDDTLDGENPPHDAFQADETRGENHHPQCENSHSAPLSLRASAEQKQHRREDSRITGKGPASAVAAPLLPYPEPKARLQGPAAHHHCAR